MKRITSLIRRAVDEYDMIGENEKIAVGVSGGKDSLILLHALADLSRYHPKHFSVIGITLDMGYHPDYAPIQRLCEKLGVEYYVKSTRIKEIIFDIRKETNPCALCAKMRRGALNDAAMEHGAYKIALGHHSDDVIETFLLSLMYEGRINCFDPVTYLDRTGITQIRPMIYVQERDIKGAVKRHDIPVIPSGCPADGQTKREEMKKLLRTMEQETFPGLKKRMFTAIQRGVWEMQPIPVKRSKTRIE